MTLGLSKSGDIGLYQHLPTATDNSIIHELIIMCEISPQKKSLYFFFQHESLKNSNPASMANSGLKVDQMSLYMYIEALITN